MVDFRWKRIPTWDAHGLYDGKVKILQFREDADGKWSKWMTVPEAPRTKEDIEADEAQFQHRRQLDYGKS